MKDTRKVNEGYIGPAISVVIPMLNSAQFLRECLDSVLGQTLENIEILCIDAGSTDGTLSILEEYEKRDPRVKIFHSIKKSYGYQVNMGIEKAKGLYLSIVESDDYIKEDMYEELYDLTNKGQLDVVKGDFCTFIGDGDERNFTYRALLADNTLYNTVVCPTEKIKMFWAYCINPPGIYRLSFIKNNQIKMNETPGASYQDNGFWFQVFSLAKTVLLHNKAYYMVRRDNINSSVFSKAKTYCMCDEYDYIREFLSKHKEIEKELAPVCAYFRFGNYKFTLNRIDKNNRKDFCQRMGNDFRRIKASGELCRTYYTKSQLAELDLLISNPERYYYTYYYCYHCNYYIFFLSHITPLLIPLICT